MYDFTNVDPVKCCAWLVLPTVYDESLSYGEQLNKFCKALNELIENNNNLPDYVAEMIQNYITSGAIDEVVRNILANYILNVKYPPKGISPAVGDGSADDTDAIQGCIDYAFNQGGGCVYFPYGKYLSRSLTLRSGVSLVGFDRYSTRIVQRGGDTKPLLSGGNVQNVQVSNLTLDGNNEVQTDDLDVINILGKDVFLTNLVVKSGYQCLVYSGLGGDLQVSDVVFGGAVKKVAVISGSDSVQMDNVKFNELGKIQGECVLDVSSNSGVYRFSNKAVSPVCVKCSGSRNTFIFDCENTTSNFEDNGQYNNFNVLGVEVKEQLADGKSSLISGNFYSSVTGNKTDNVNGSDTKTINKNKSEIVKGNNDEEVKGIKTVNTSGGYNVIGKRFAVKTNDGIQYSTPVKLNSVFRYIPMLDINENEYNLLVQTDKTKEIDKILNLPYANIKDYGAIGDGIADDTNSFNQAFNSNSFIFVPEGSYNVKNIIFPENFTMVSKGKIIKEISISTNGTLIGGEYSGISTNKDIKINFIKSKSSSNHALHITGGKPDVKNSWFSGTSNTILFEDLTSGNLANCYIECIDDTDKMHCVQINRCFSINIISCEAKNGNWFGFSIYNSSFCKISGNTSIDSYAEGINLENSSSCLVNDNYVCWLNRKSHDYGMSVFGNNDKIANLNTLVNNVIYDCLQSGIAIDGNASSNTVANNTIINCNNGDSIRNYAFNSSQLEGYTGKPGGNIFENNTILHGSACAGLYHEENINSPNYINGNYSIEKLNSGVFNGTFPGANININPNSYTFTSDNGTVSNSFIEGISPKFALINCSLNVSRTGRVTIGIPFNGSSLMIGFCSNETDFDFLFNTDNTLFFNAKTTGIHYLRAIIRLN